MQGLGMAPSFAVARPLSDTASVQCKSAQRPVTTASSELLIRGGGAHGENIVRTCQNVVPALKLSSQLFELPHQSRVELVCPPPAKSILLPGIK